MFDVKKHFNGFGHKESAPSPLPGISIKKQAQGNWRVSVRKIPRETDISKSLMHQTVKKELGLEAYKLQKAQFLTDENKRM